MHERIASACRRRRRSWATRRFAGSLVTGGFLVAACTDVLSINGKYVLSDAEERSHIDSGIPDGAGGTQNDGDGGRGGATGGTSAGGTLAGGAPSHAGTSADSGQGCPAGHYAGSLAGGIALVGVPFTVTLGTISFDLRGTGGVLDVSAGTAQAELSNDLLKDVGKFSLSLTGKFDCASRTIEHGNLTGRIDAVGVIPLPLTITGAWEGTMGANGAFKGSWTESQVGQSSTNGDAAAPLGACVPGLTADVQRGCGTWDAR